MNRPPPVSSNDRAFLIAALNSEDGIKLRLDGRTPNDIRTINIKIGDEIQSSYSAVQTNKQNQSSASQFKAGIDNSHVEVSLGSTRALALVTGDLVKPHPHRPTEGFLSFHVNLSPMSSPYIDLGRPSERAVEIGRLIDRCFRESRAVDTESLCLLAGELVWSLRVDVTLIDDCGNSGDCCSLAALIALIEFRRPAVTVTGTRVTVHSVQDRQPVALALHHWPVACSFALFDEGKLMVIDPSYTEENVSEANLTIACNQHAQVCAIHKRGGAMITKEMFQQASMIAVSKSKEITQHINQVTQERDLKRRIARGERGARRVLGAKEESKPVPVADADEDDVLSSEHVVPVNLDSFGSTLNVGLEMNAEQAAASLPQPPLFDLKNKGAKIDPRESVKQSKSSKFDPLEAPPVLDSIKNEWEEEDEEMVISDDDSEVEMIERPVKSITQSNTQSNKSESKKSTKIGNRGTSSRGRQR